MGVNAQGDEKFGHWLANSRAVRDVAEVLARKCKALPASEKFKTPTQGVMFLNGFLHPNGMLTTDESMTKEMGCTAAQALDYDWDENDTLDCSPEKMEAEMPRFCSYIKGSLGVTSMDHPDVKTLLEYPGLCLLGLGTATQKVLVPQGIPGTVNLHEYHSVVLRHGGYLCHPSAADQRPVPDDRAYRAPHQHG
jgi:hypothetical protein